MPYIWCNVSNQYIEHWEMFDPDPSIQALHISVRKARARLRVKPDWICTNKFRESVRCITQDEYDVMDKYKMSELKNLVRLNHYDVDTIHFNKRKQFWARAYIETIKWGMNIFVSGTELNLDVYRLIHKFI